MSRRQPIRPPFLPQLPFDIQPDLRRYLVAVGSRVEAISIDRDPPGQPTDIVGTTNTFGNLLTWNPAPKATGYLIYRNSTPTLASVSGNATVIADLSGGRNNRFLDSEDALSPNSTRYYWVRAYNAAGVEGPLSRMVSVNNYVNATDSLTVGQSTSTGSESIIVGDNSQVSGADGIVIGTGASGNGARQIMIGNATLGSSFADSLVIGYDAAAEAANQATLGDPSSTYYYSEARWGVGANGQRFHSHVVLSELTTIAAAATTDTAIQIPANVVVKGVTVRVTTAIPTAVTFTVTGTTSGTTFSTAAVSTALNSTDKGNAAGAYYNGTAQTIRITPNASPAANTGRVRVSIIYEDITPATS